MRVLLIVLMELEGKGLSLELLNWLPEEGMGALEFGIRGKKHL